MNTRQSSKKEWTLERKNALMGYIMVSPILVGILLFTVVPVFFSLYISFTDWDMLHPQTWVGLQNYQTIFSDKMLGIVTKNTLVYCVIAIPGAILFGMLLALFIATLCFSPRHCPLWLTPGALLLLLPLFWFTLVKFAQNELPVIERAFYRLLLAAVDGSAEAI